MPSKSTFWTLENALAVLREEVKLRTNQQYLSETKSFIQRHECPPIELDEDIERSALRKCGYKASSAQVEAYRKFVREMSIEDRAEFFYLKANDQFFRPNLNTVGKSILTQLVTKDYKEAKFTDFELTKSDGYFIIAVPST